MGTSWILKSVDFGGVDCYETIIDIAGIQIQWWKITESLRNNYGYLASFSNRGWI